MSEYQYYEFAAIDGPISDDTFGDFHGRVDTLLKYYDAHFHIANWGTVRLGLAFPKGTITPEIIQPYLQGGERYEDTLTFKEVGDRSIICWERNEEGGWGGQKGRASSINSSGFARN